MPILLNVFVFLFGTIVGSFLNVVALRHNTGMPVARGRSQCFSCSKQLYWYELVPIFSFFVLRGKCSVCKSKISLQYPLVEIFTGVIFLATFIKFGPSFFLPYYFFIFSLLIIIAVYDFKHKIIPDGWAFIFGFATFATALTSFFYGQGATMLDLFAGPIVALPFALLWVVSKGKWVGLGDAKLLLGLGWMLGFVHSISAVVLAVWVGAIWGVLTIFVQKFTHTSSRFRVTMKSEIPFGPFLILGALLVFFFGFDVVGLSLFSQF